MEINLPNRPIFAILARTALAVCLVFGLFASQPAAHARAAATITVTNNTDSDPGSLRDAIANAAAGDTINFAGDYTITLASQLEIDKNITITGAGHSIILDGNHAVRVLHVNTADYSSGVPTFDHLNIVNGSVFGDEYGGGMMLEYDARAVVSNSTFFGNTAEYDGGAINNYYGNLTVFNSTFDTNSSLLTGGAINNFFGTIALTNNTFFGNTSTLYGSAIVNTWGTVTFQNNIIVSSSDADACHLTPDSVQDTSTFTDLGGNIQWGDSSCFGVSANPMFGAPGDYGGGVYTIPLLPGSPAMNHAADCPSFDPRGVARAGACDSGAFESSGFTLIKTGGDNQITIINTDFPSPLTLNVIPINLGDPVNGGLITFSAPASGASASLTGSPATITGGVASVTARANGSSGGYSVTASTTGASPAAFTLNNFQALPLAPTNLHVTGVSKWRIMLDWNNPDPNNNYFKIYRDGVLITQPTVFGIFYYDDNLTCGTTYSYEVKASNSAGDSAGISASGATWACEPLTPASDITFSERTLTSMTVNWTNGSGANRLVLVKAGAAVDAGPWDFLSYTANAVFGAGSQIGSGNYVVYNGSGSSVTITGLLPDTRYYVAVYEFNGSDQVGDLDYLTTAFATGSQKTRPYQFFAPYTRR